LLPLKTGATYFLLFVCLTGIFFASFHSTLKLLKQSVDVSICEVDIDDLEEGESEKKDVIERDFLTSKTLHIDDCLLISQIKEHLNHSDAKLLTMYVNIQSPPPKIG